MLLVCAALLAARPAFASEQALQAILDEANDLKDGDACDGAVPLYDEVISRADADAPIRGYALYNRAVCEELLDSPDAARRTYGEVLAGPRTWEVRRDALFRRGLLEVLREGDLRGALRDLRLARKGATPLDAAIVDLQVARASFLLRRPQKAARLVARAAAVIESARDEDADRRGTPLDWYVGEAAALRGDLWLRAGAAVPLTVRGAGRVTKRIEKRAAFLESAQSFYVLAIEAGRAPWSQHALLQMGRGYATVAAELQALRASIERGEGTLTTTERAALAAWLEPRIAGQLRKATESWLLCARVETEIGGAPLIGSSCRAEIDAVVRRQER